MNQLMSSCATLTTMMTPARDLPKPCFTSEARALLQSVLRSREALEVVAAASYVHQLGFEKYVLSKAANGETIRLHFWPDGSTGQIEDIHSHCASFSSYVLKGKLTAQSFTTRPGTSHAIYRYRFDMLAGHSQVDHAGTTDIREGDSMIYTQGDSYTMEMSELHRVTDVSRGTATISRWHERSTHALVIKSKESEAVDCNRHSGMVVEYVAGQLSRILQEISK